MTTASLSTASPNERRPSDTTLAELRGPSRDALAAIRRERAELEHDLALLDAEIEALDDDYGWTDAARSHLTPLPALARRRPTATTWRQHRRATRRILADVAHPHPDSSALAA